MAIKQFGKKFENWVHRISRMMNVVSMIVLFAMMLIQTADVIGRYGFNAPIKAAMDLIEVMMSILVFWSLAYCASINEHIRVDLVLIRLSKRTRENIERITFLAGAFILALITWRLGLRAWTIIQDRPGPVTLTLLIPYWPFIVAATIGSFVFCLEYLIRVFNPNSGKQEAPRTEPPPPVKTPEKSAAG
jgi:TRAP-type C4-dicarboxylate transport system permease small subunit